MKLIENAVFYKTKKLINQQIIVSFAIYFRDVLSSLVVKKFTTSKRHFVFVN